MPKPPREVYVLHLTPAAGWGVPGIVRLRRLLKLALRSCGLRCVSVEAAKPDSPPGDDRHEAASGPDPT